MLNLSYINKYCFTRAQIKHVKYFVAKFISNTVLCSHCRCRIYVFESPASLIAKHHVRTNVDLIVPSVPNFNYDKQNAKMLKG